MKTKKGKNSSPKRGCNQQSELFRDPHRSSMSVCVRVCVHVCVCGCVCVRACVRGRVVVRACECVLCVSRAVAEDEVRRDWLRPASLHRSLAVATPPVCARTHAHTWKRVSVPVSMSLSVCASERMCVCRCALRLETSVDGQDSPRPVCKCVQRS